MTQPVEVQPSSGNIFADLDLAGSDELLVKAELAHKINGILTSQNLSQAEAVDILAIEPAQVTALISGKLGEFSTAQLFRFLNALGRDVDIVVKPKALPQAQIRVIASSA